MGKITEYPIVNSLSDDDTLFVSKDGALSQIKKSDLDIGGGGGGTFLGWEKVASNVTTKNMSGKSYKEVLIIQSITRPNNEILSFSNVIPYDELANRKLVMNGYYYDTSYHGCVAFEYNTYVITTNDSWTKISDGGSIIQSSKLDIYAR